MRGVSQLVKSICAVTLITTATSTVALAGGFDRGGVNIDQLFDRDQVSTSVRFTYVNPQRQLRNVNRPALAAVPPVAAAFNGRNVHNEGSYVVPRFGVKTSIADGIDCLASYSEPFGGDANYGTGNVYSPSTVEFFLDTKDYGLTCSYQQSLGEANFGGVSGESFLRFIGGFSYMEVDGFLSRESLLFGAGGGAVAPQPGALGTFTISDTTYGWRAGLAYEIPALAVNASIIYSSKYDLDLTGVQDTTALTNLGAGATVIPIRLGGAEIPQSIDVKLQTGINETTLAFLNLRWQDWSNLQILPVLSATTGAALGSTLDVSYRDGYTVTAGIGKRLSDKVSTLTSLTWDRGTSTIVGTQTDSWTIGAGLRYKENENLRFSVGGAIGILTSGSSGINPANPDPSAAVTYEFGDDMVYALTAGLKYRF